MPTKIRFLLLTFLILFSFSAVAKTQQTMLHAFVVDPEGNMPDSLEISLTNAADTVAVPFRLMKSSHDSGIFNYKEVRILFDGEIGRDYSLMVESEGFKPIVKIFTIVRRDKVKNFGFLHLERTETEELAGVTVTATRVKMVMHGDTAVFNADAFNLADGSMLQDLVRQLPGIKLEQDGVITYNGRRLTELLLNGKDFFSGNPKVALENLPAYTVKNVKVYDKKSKNAHLTGANQRIENDPDKENLVLDVNLKKEYIKGGIGNLEGGYGIGERYIARVFGMAYTDALRLSVYGQANNIGDTSGFSIDGDWSGGWQQPGETDTQSGGIDYNYSNKDESITTGGNINVMHTDGNTDNLSSSVSFYPSADLYNRSGAHTRAKALNLDFTHNFELTRKWMWLRVDPKFNWNRKDNSSRSRAATFNAPVAPESYRGEALDSVFAGSRLYSRDMLTRLLVLGAGKSENLGASLNTSMMISPESWQGNASVAVSGSYTRNTADNRNIYNQALGPAGNPETKPQNSDRYSRIVNTGKNFGTSLGYSHNIQHFGEKFTRGFSFSPGLSYNHSDNSGGNNMFTADSLPDLSVLPSVQTPEHAKADLENSYYSQTLTNTFGASANVSFRLTPTANSETGYNTRYSLSLMVSFRHNHQSLHYEKPEAEPQTVSRTLNSLTPAFVFAIGTDKNNCNTSFYFNYSNNVSSPSLNYLLNTRTSENPFEVYLGADELKNTTNHSFSMSFSRMYRGLKMRNFMANANLNLTRNAVANTRVYNENTGVTVNRPINVNGNWMANLNLSYFIMLGSKRQFNLNSGLGTSVNHSVDYLSLGGTPERSRVMNYSVSPSVGLGWTPSSAVYVSANINMSIDRQTSDRENFDNRTSFRYAPTVSGTFNLPADLQIVTTLSPSFLRGYSDPNMNISEWLWNMSVAKRLFKGKVLLKATAVDLLHSVKNVQTTVNAQGRYETWNRTIPRYVLFGLTYNFSLMPGKGVSGAKLGMPVRGMIPVRIL